MNKFSELTLAAPLQRNLTRNLFETPTPVQAEAIPPAMTGSDVVATAQTGTGKTLAFLIPIVNRLLENKQRGIQALILAPTRELALQIAESFQKLTSETALRAAVVVGGLSENTQLGAIRRGVQVVIATPGRLEDFLGRKLVDLNQVSVSVLDEADRMLDMGFLPAIEKILSALPKERQSLFFSATMERNVERLIRRHSVDPIRIAIHRNTTAQTPEQVDLHLYEIDNNLKLQLLRHLLDSQEGSTLVFARTKHGADRLAKKLSGSGVRAVAMHGDRTQNQRNQALAGFRDGRYRVLVATDVAARGIHVDSVAHVVNFDLPQAPSDFIHRVGRTGRAGQLGVASTFYSRPERGEIKRIESECKVRLAKQELSRELLVGFEEKSMAEQSAKPVQDTPRREAFPSDKPHHPNKPHRNQPHHNEQRPRNNGNRFAAKRTQSRKRVSA